MAKLEQLALDKVVPQIRAPGVGDSYQAPREIFWTTGKVTSEVADGASAVAFAQASPAYVTAGAKIISWLNDVTEQAHLTYDGDLYLEGGITKVTSIKFDLTAGISVSQGEMAWNADEETIDVGLNGAIWQGGQEVHYHARNNSGALIPDGAAVMATGTIGTSGRITIDLMDGSNIANAKFFLGIATEAIADGTDGKVTFFGKVRGIKTDYATWADEDVLWVDVSTPGDLTNVQPTSGCRLPIAFLVHAHANNGTIAVRATDGTYLAEAHDTQIASPATGEVLQHNGTAWINSKVDFPNLNTDLADANQFFDGAMLDQPDVNVTSNGTVISLSLEKSGGGDIRVVFSTGVTVLDTTPAATISLTAGSDVSPQINFIYIPESTKVLTVSTSGFPVGSEFSPVATVLCQSAASLQTDGAYKVHAWTDHASSDVNNGHLAHVNHWIRHQPATWQSGAALTPTITINGGAEDNIDVATTVGEILQLHDHAYPAFDTAVSSEVYVVNDFTAAYTKITDLNAADDDDAGNAIANNRWTNLVLWGVVSEDTGDCKLMLNLPAGFHSSATAATADTQRFSNFNIPDEYRGVGFLIARLTFKFSNAASGTWTLEENLDLRSTGAQGGTSVASTSEFVDNVFRLLNVADPTKEIDFDASGITTGTIRTITMPDRDVDLGVVVLPIIGAASDETTDLTTGTAKMTFIIPYSGGFTLTGVIASLTGAPTGSTAVFDINEAGVSVLSTKISIDVSETDSTTAATPPVISDASLAGYAEMTFDIDQIGSSDAGTGIKFYLIGYPTTGI